MTALDLAEEIEDLLGPIPGSSAAKSRPPRVAPPAHVAPLSDTRCSKAELAAFLDLDPRRVGQLVERGVIKCAGRGAQAFNLVEATRAYCNYLSNATRGRLDDSDPLKIQNIRKAKAGADLSELRAARERGDLIPAADVEHSWSLIVRDVQAAIRAVPARLANNLGHLTKADLATVKAELDLALERLADGATAQAEEIDADD